MARFIELNRPFVHKHNYRMTAERKKGKREKRKKRREERDPLIDDVDFMTDREI